MRRALLAAVIAALCLPAGAAARVPRDFFGVMANGPLDAPGFALDAESAAMHSAGVQTERMEISWDLVEPQKGQYDYALTDRKVLAAARAGIDVLALIVRSPGWAAQHPGNPFSAPRDPADYAAFATTLVARYGPGGALWAEHPEVAAAPVRAWQVWNEPNLEVYWSEQPFMRGYARLLDAAYAAIKQADPGATVAMAGLANFSWRDLERLFAKGGAKLRFDVAAVHPFSGRPSNAREDRPPQPRGPRPPRRQAQADLAHRADVVLGQGQKQKLTQNWETTEAGQALRLRQAYRLFVRARHALRLERIYWYTWVTVDRDSPNSFDYSGLRTQRPDGSVVDKPAARAFRAVVRRYR